MVISSNISQFEIELYHRSRLLARSLERKHPDIWSLLGYAKGLQHLEQEGLQHLEQEGLQQLEKPLEDSGTMSAIIALLAAPAPALPDRDPHVYGA